MTALAERKSKPLVFVTSDTIWEQGENRPVVVEAHPFYCSVRLKNMRQSYTVPWSAIWSMAARAEADKVARAKKSTHKVTRGML